VASVEALEPAKESGVRLERDDTSAEPGPGVDVVPGVGPQIEGKVARLEEEAEEALKPCQAERDRVVGEERARHPDDLRERGQGA
jgi:hypothetical protein